MLLPGVAAMSMDQNEAWIYDNPTVLENIRRGLSEASAGKVKKVENLEKFFEEL
jgi:hypothetical protein